jgi:hypothetical protein
VKGRMLHATLETAPSVLCAVCPALPIIGQWLGAKWLRCGGAARLRSFHQDSRIRGVSA